jgi:NAD-dependent dihydropyrimidine dehydrogenase PreA subunit
MTYVITEQCKGSKDTSCVDVCPVDCIHPAPGENGHAECEMLFIDPAECIDCGACTEVCPVEAPLMDRDVPEQWVDYVRLNAAFFEKP